MSGAHERVNRTELRRCPDCWHDVVIPGLEMDEVDEEGNPCSRNGNPIVPPEAMRMILLAFRCLIPIQEVFRIVLVVSLL